MTVTAEKELLAHLLRRAGFGASGEELDIFCEIGYEGTVEKLLSLDSEEAVDEYSLLRRHPITEVPG